MNEIRIVELFAGVGGFSVGFNQSNKDNNALFYKTVWYNQWEPSTKKQDAYEIYARKLDKGDAFSNTNIYDVPTEHIDQYSYNMLVGGFPCQNYSVATSASKAKGIEGEKGVLWWQIYRILDEAKNRPDFLLLENVDRLINSPSSQRGRDFAIILASLSDLGYTVEWRVLNAAEYGFPQRRKRIYILAYKNGSVMQKTIGELQTWVLNEGVMAKAFPAETDKKGKVSVFEIEGDLVEISKNFNANVKITPFGDAGVMRNRKVFSVDTIPAYNGHFKTLGDVLLPLKDVPRDFIVPEKEVAQWQFLKGAKTLKRINKEGFEYNYSEGSMAFPDYLDRASRTIITAEGGASPSRFKHIILQDGVYRRLTPVELERLNMFPDNHTEGASDTRRAFLMGNALVCGIVTDIANELYRRLKD